MGAGRVTRPVSAFHRSAPAGGDGGAGPGRGLAQRDATAATALGASEAATSRRREPLPPCQERPVPVGCLPVPGKDVSGLTGVWREGRWRASPPHPPKRATWGLRDEGPLGWPSVTRSSWGGVQRSLEFSATASVAKTLTARLP